MLVSTRCVYGAIISLALILTMWIFPRPLSAQSAANSGQIVGQVMDPSSASVVGAEVTVRNKDTNFSRTAVTDDQGRYAVPLLPLGEYEITAKASGFEPTVEQAVVMLGRTVTANFNLSVGINREAIQVTPGVLPSDITMAAARSVLTDLQLRHLPTNGERVQNLIWQVPTGQIEPE